MFRSFRPARSRSRRTAGGRRHRAGGYREAGLRGGDRRHKKTGVREIVMLTGDNETAAQAVAAQVGVTDYRAGLLPQDKAKAVEAMQGRRVFVGDGVNDAPVLAAADCGVAVGLGSQAAIRDGGRGALERQPRAAAAGDPLGAAQHERHPIQHRVRAGDEGRGNSLHPVRLRADVGRRVRGCPALRRSRCSTRCASCASCEIRPSASGPLRLGRPFSSGIPAQREAAGALGRERCARVKYARISAQAEPFFRHVNRAGLTHTGRRGRSRAS